MDKLMTSKPHVHFEVEKVIGISKDGTYQVQWAPMWVSSFHLRGCEHLIQDFLKQQLQKDNHSSAITSTETKCMQNNHDSEVSLRPSEGETHNSDSYADDGVIPESNYIQASSHDVPRYDVTKDFGNLDSDFSASHLSDYAPAGNSDELVNGASLAEGCDIDDVTIKLEDDDEMDYHADNVRSDAIEADNDSNAALTASLDETNNQINFPAMPTSSSWSNTTAFTNINNNDNINNTTQQTQVAKKRYHCTLCGKWFALKPNLDRHIRTHTGEKPFNCDICHKSFNDNSNLKRHLKIHNNSLKSLFCYICKKSFSCRDELNMHVKTNHVESLTDAGM